MPLAVFILATVLCPVDAHYLATGTAVLKILPNIDIYLPLYWWAELFII
jgi:hypothetical protein